MCRLKCISFLLLLLYCVMWWLSVLIFYICIVYTFSFYRMCYDRMNQVFFIFLWHRWMWWQCCECNLHTQLKLLSYLIKKHICKKSVWMEVLIMKWEICNKVWSLNQCSSIFYSMIHDILLNLYSLMEFYSFS